jgi:hypothetical protein
MFYTNIRSLSNIAALPIQVAVKFKTALVVVLLVAGAWAFEAHARSGTQRTLSSVASQLAGRPVHVRCQSFWANLLSINGHAGEVQFDANGNPSDSAWLTRGTCGHLHRFIASHGADLECLRAENWAAFQWNGPWDDCISKAEPVAQAVIVLAHESMHLRGTGSESDAQCGAERLATQTVELLGGDPATGPLLERLARAWNPFMPTEYQAPSCPQS